MTGIGILNFDNSRYFISHPNDVCWYKERYDFAAVLYLEEAVTNRERFSDICRDLGVMPIYGLRLRISLSQVTGYVLEVIACEREGTDPSILDGLSDKARLGEITLDDVLHVRDRVLIGLTIGEGYVDADSICGVYRCLIQPDFIFVRYDLINRDFYEEHWDAALHFLYENDVILIPQRTQQREQWRYLFDDADDVAEKGKRDFLQRFTDGVS